MGTDAWSKEMDARILEMRRDPLEYLDKSREEALRAVRAEFNPDLGVVVRGLSRVIGFRRD